MWLWEHRANIGLLAVATIAAGSLVSAIVLAFHDMAGPSATCGVLGLLLLAFVRLSKFRKLKGLGFEAELWEEKQVEAERLVAKTRDLLTLLSGTIATLAPRMNRMMQGFSRREQLDLVQQIEVILRDAGVEEARRAALYSEIERWTAFDLAMPTTHEFSSEVHSRANEESNAIRREFGSPIKDSAGFSAAQSRVREINAHAFNPNDLFSLPLGDWPKEIRRRIEQSPLSDQKRGELLKKFDEDLLDLEAWVNGRTVRRPEKFFSDRKS